MSKWHVTRKESDILHFNPNHDPKTGQFAQNPWGTQNRVLKKGQKIYRLANNPFDTTYDNKKYVSLTKSDHEKWQKLLGDAYSDAGQTTYNMEYELTKDTNIANYAEVGKIVMERLKKNDKNFAKMLMTDTEYASKALNYESDDENDMFGLNFAMQTKTGKAIVDELLKRGFGGVQDRHGTNTAENPVIIFDPDKKMRLKTISLNKRGK